jgi:hypothetical protein
MLMKPTRRARAIQAVALTSATLALAAGAALASTGDWAQERAVLAATSETVLPGEGRPPSPGPTNPDGPTF